jgi:uracil-DNA glycosylase
MIEREELLRELGLAPVWRLRRASTAPGDSFAAVRTPIVDTTRSSDEALARRERIATLDYRDLVADIGACTACALCKSRRKTVPGVGDVDAQWMFIGEAPGADEDAQGEPFVGAAGQLLDNMLMALGLERASNVYIANVLKCRPPNNRAPEPSEAAACAPYLDRQIDLVAPRLIVALGKSAACRLLDVDASVASLRNRVHRYRDIPMVVTYHPAYLLRTPADKAKAWEDLLFARRTLREATAANGSARPR